MWDEPLAARCNEAVALIERLPDNRRVLVVADADVDGTSAAAALALALHRIGRRFHVRLSRRRDSAFFDDLLAEGPDLLITADLGAHETPRFAKARVPTIVLDHHVPAGDGDGVGLVHVNPHLEHEDGSATASGAAVSVAFATALLDAHNLPANHLLPYAFLGAGGDRYHGAAGDAGLHGRLRRLLDGGASQPHVTTTPGPALADLAVKDALAASIDPYIARAAGRPEAAAKLVAPLGIDGAQPVAALDADERRTLASWLALELLEQGAQPALLEGALAPRLHLGLPGLHGGIGADDAVSLIDAAARAGQAETALAALLGHTAAWNDLRALLQAYREKVRAPLAGAARGRLIPLGPAHLLRIDDGRFAGPVADRVMAWTKAGSAPVVVLGPGHRGLKVSLRARPGGPRWALDEAAREAERFGGTGGGHALAAGAVVADEKEAQFLEAVAKRLAQVAGAPKAEATA